MIALLKKILAPIDNALSMWLLSLVSDNMLEHFVTERQDSNGRWLNSEITPLVKSEYDKRVNRCKEEL